MPRKEIDYSKSCIYQIVCRDPTILDSYIGSTTNLPKRRKDHKKSCNNPNAKGHNIPVYRFIRDHGGFDNFKVVWLVDCSCSSRNELFHKERELFDLLKPTLNKIVPIVLDTDAAANKVKKKESRAKYKAANKDKEKEYNAKYKAANKEELREYNTKYYAANKEFFAARAQEKVKCPCGAIISRCNMGRHTKTKKHKAYLESKKKKRFVIHQVKIIY